MKQKAPLVHRSLAIATQTNQSYDGTGRASSTVTGNTNVTANTNALTNTNPFGPLVLPNSLIQAIVFPLHYQAKLYCMPQKPCQILDWKNTAHDDWGFVDGEVKKAFAGQLKEASVADTEKWLGELAKVGADTYRADLVFRSIRGS